MSGIVSDNQGRSSGLVKSTTVAEYDDDKVQANIALLGFKTAVNGSLAKYSLQDQIIDEYVDATGIDASASTNEQRHSTGYFYGSSTGSISGDGTSDTYSGYTSYTFLSSGDFIVAGGGVADIMIVAGGGTGGDDSEGDAGGGGAGGMRVITDITLTAQTYAIVVGDGGDNANGQEDGDDSSGLGYTASGGGSGASSSVQGQAGGSGGGGSGTSAPTAGSGNAGSYSPSEGNSGGAGDPQTGWLNKRSGGGGGGAGGGGQAGQGNNSTGGVGGTGTANTYRTGSSVTYAGGGGGGAKTTGAAGGSGGGGTGASGGSSGVTSGSANTGGGGGGGSGGSDGGSGIVVIRIADGDLIVAGNQLTLQSTDTTASTANPDYADMVCLIENAHGTATLNTDIKGYISEDSGVTFTQGTFVDEGSWGTNKKIIAFHDLDISAQSGSSMCYKITTHNQSNGSKETNIHATSIGWK